MRRIRIIALALIVAAGLARAQDVNRPATLPDGVAGLVEFHNLDAIHEHLKTFLAAASPETPQFPLVSTGLAMMAKTTKPGLMDPSEPVRILLVQAGEGKLSLVLQFSAKDVTAYRKSLLPALKRVEDLPDGITSYTQEKRGFDGQAFQKATQEEKKDFQRFMTVSQTPVVIGESDKVVCVGDNVSAVQTVLALVKKGALGDAPLIAGGDVAAQVEVRALLSYMATGKTSAFAGLKDGMKGMLSMMRPPAGQNPEQLQRILDIEIDTLESCAKQVERASARLDFAPDEARLTLATTPVRGGKLAAYLASVKPGVPGTLKYLPDDAFIVAAFKVGDLAPLAAPMEAFAAKLMAASGVAAADVAPLTKAAGEILRMKRDEAAIALCAGGGVRAVAATRFEDAAAYQAARQKLMQASKPLMEEVYQKMGMPMKLETETIQYNGHEIARWKFPLDAKPPEGATPEQAAALEQRQKMMKAMYGDALTMDSAVMGKDYVFTLGKGSLESLELILDGKQKKATETESLKAVLAALPAETTGFALIHVTGLADWALSQLRAQQGPGRGMIPEAKFQPGPGATVLCLKAPDGSLTCTLRVPAAEIKAVVDGFKAGQNAAQNEMRTRQQEMRLRQAAPATPVPPARVRVQPAPVPAAPAQ